MHRDRRKRSITQWLVSAVLIAAICPGREALAASGSGSGSGSKDILLWIGSNLAAVNGQVARIDAENRMAAPFIEQDTAYVPLRFVSEMLGGKVGWDEETQSVTLATYAAEIKLVYDSKEVKVNGTIRSLPTAPILRHHVTYVPLRTIAESLGGNVGYQDGMIRITGDKQVVLPMPDKSQYAVLKEGLIYRVYQNGYFLDGFTSKQQAVDYAKQWASSWVKDREDGTVWDNLPPYRVYQNGKFLTYYDSYAAAVGYAKQYAASAVYYRTAQAPAWTQEGARPASIYIDVPHIVQMPELPRGCEVTALAMMLQFGGVPADKMTLAKEVRKDWTPYSQRDGTKFFGNPDRGFVGDMYSFANPGFGVYHGPVFELAAGYLPNRAVDLTGLDLDDVLHFVGQGTPVWVIANTMFRKLEPSYFQTWQTPDGPIWLTMKEHSVVIVGYDENYIYINDPLNNVDRVWKSSFKEAWEQMGRQAISLLPEA